MNALLIWAIVIVALLVWVFSAVRVLTIMVRRHDEVCEYGYKKWSDCDIHLFAIWVGWILGPLMYLSVVMLQLAEGTYLDHYRKRKLKKAALSKKGTSTNLS